MIEFHNLHSLWGTWPKVKLYSHFDPRFLNIWLESQILWRRESRSWLSLASFCTGFSWGIQYSAIWIQHSKHTLWVKNGLLVAGKLLQSPLEAVNFRNIHCMPNGNIERRTLNIFRHRHQHLHIIGNTPFLVVGFNLDQKPNSGGVRILNYDIDIEEWFNSDIESVAH